MKTLGKIILGVGLWISFQFPAKAQAEYELNPAAQQKMANLGFLEGEWKGTGWTIGQDRIRKTFEQEEKIQWMLSGTLLQVEGKGTSNGQVVHHALALLHPGEKDGEFQFTSFLQSGMHGTYPAKLVDEKLIWQPVEQVRYTIWINEKGQWQEIGEYLGGTQWFKFFEMTLDKVN